MSVSNNFTHLIDYTHSRTPLSRSAHSPRWRSKGSARPFPRCSKLLKAGSLQRLRHIVWATAPGTLNCKGTHLEGAGQGDPTLRAVNTQWTRRALGTWYPALVSGGQGPEQR